MHIQLSIKMDRPYYETVYAEQVRYRLKYRKYSPYVRIAAFFLALFLGVSIWMKGQAPIYWILPLLMLAMGIQEWYSNKRHREKWLQKLLDQPQTGETSNLTFTPDYIYTEGPLAEGKFKWAALEMLQETPSGIFLSTAKGFSMYVPKENFAADADWEKILVHAETQQTISVKRTPASRG